MKRKKVKTKSELFPDYRPLHLRESKMDTRKGMPVVKKTGYVDLTEYKEQLLFPEK